MNFLIINLKIDNLVWGEIDNKEHLMRIEEKILPKIEKVIS